MKVTKKALIGLMGLSLLGGIGGAVALTINSASESFNGNVDKAIYLYWGNGSTTNSAIAQVENLVKDVAQYRIVSVAPKTSTNLAGTVTVTFTIAAETDVQNKTAVLTGLTVKIYPVLSTTTIENAHDYIYDTPVTASFTLDPTHLTNHVDINVTASYTTTHYYAMEFVHDGTDAGDGNAFGGTMTISQSFVAA